MTPGTKKGKAVKGADTDTQQRGRAWFCRAPSLLGKSWSRDSRLLTAASTLLVGVAAVATFLKETLAAELCYYIFIYFNLSCVSVCAFMT